MILGKYSLPPFSGKQKWILYLLSEKWKQSRISALLTSDLSTNIWTSDDKSWEIIRDMKQRDTIFLIP